MNIIVFGATGRVGACFVRLAQARGHEITAFVREESKGKARGARIFVGDVRNANQVTEALSPGFDAAVVCIGETALRPSTIVTDGFRSVIAGMKKNRMDRILGVSGSAEIPEKTALGRFYTSVLRLTPVGHAIRDHDRAFAEVSASGLNWTLAGCNYIQDGPSRGPYKKEFVFRGGFKIIRPIDVADFLVKEIDDNRFPGRIVGLWY